MINYELYSFDIFDTIITRRTAQPQGITALMQHELRSNEKYKNFPNDVKTNFFKYRTNSEYRQRRLNASAKNGADVSFDQIYDDLKETYFLTEEQTQTLKELEIQTEFDNIVPINENIRKINNLIENGRRVILISDMYFDESVIRKFLAKTQLKPDIKIYVSSECGSMKETGELYKFVREQENIDFENWCHIGDNMNADYRQALYLGINSELYHYIKLKTYEERFLNSHPDSPFAQLTIGCAKNLRLQNYNISEKFDLGVSLAAPIFYPYVLWLLNQAQKCGIKYLYFLARDGYILQKIADIIIKDKNLNIKTEYVYGSKKAWRLPSLTLDNKLIKSQFAETLCWSHTELEKLTGLTRKELCKILPKKLQCYKSSMSEKKIKNLNKFLNENNDWYRLMLKKRNPDASSAIRYLKQLADGAKGEKFAFVDIDGTRFTMNCMSALMREVYDGELSAFYLTSTPNVFAPDRINYCHFFALRKTLVGHVMELLARAPHGQTLGYEGKDGVMVPILEKIPLKSFEDWKFDEYIAGIEAFTSEMAYYNTAFPDVSFENQDIMERYIYFMARDVDRDTANLLGTIIHHLYGDENKEFAPKVGFTDAVKYLVTKKMATESILYSKVRSNIFVQKIIEYRMAHPDIRKEILNLFIHKRRRQAYLTIFGHTIDFGSLIFKRSCPK